MHQVRKQGQSAPGEHVLGPTRYENRPKVRLVAHWLPKVRENEVRLKAQYQI